MPRPYHVQAGEPPDVGIRKLAAQESFLRQILDINPNLIFAKDRQGRFTLVNKAVADVYGTTVEQLLGKTDADFNSDAEQVAFFRRIDLQVMDSQKELLIPEEVLTDSTGKRHWLQTVKRPIIGPDGVANQVLGVATDITQRRELEDQLRQAQKMEAIGQLAGGIAHDFNNMLAVILGNAERLLDKCRRRTPDDRSLIDGVELIHSAGVRASDLVSQLLTFSRKQHVTPIVLNLGEVVAGLDEILRTLLGERIRLVLDRGDASASIRIDRGRLEQLIVNLAVNARDAMPAGGQLIISTARPARADPRFQSAPPGEYVMLCVRDTGVGIPPNLINRIFEPFFSTKSASGKGCGLGLSIVYGIVQQAGGSIGVESEPDQGTTFRIFFPAIPDPVTLVAEPASPEHCTGTETIILCEDQEDVLRLVCGILTEYGYHVLPASSGNEGVRVASQYEGEINLLLTDVVMPGMTGWQLAEAVSSLHPNVRVLFMTGYPAEVLGSLDDLDLEHRVITKPFQTAALLQAVRSLLDS